MNRSFKAMLVAATLLAGTAGWAQDAPPPATMETRPHQGGNRERGEGRMRNGVGGTITAISGDTITLKTMDGKTGTVKLTSTTEYRKLRDAATLKDFKVGDMVGVRGESSGEDTWTAQTVVLLPPNSGQMMVNMREGLGKQFIVGKVTSIDGTKLVIARPDGENQTIQVDEDTSFRKNRENITLPDIKVGDMIMGRGELKSGTFVPKTLNVVDPEQMQRMRDGFGGGRGGPEGRKPGDGAPGSGKQTPPAPPTQQ